MLRRLAVGMSVGVLLALLAIVPSPGEARAATVCTGWTSEYAPPPTIRVFRTWGPAAGTVETVEFRGYVEDVLSHEFGWNVPGSAMLAGAVTVKQYAWYYAMHWRGRSASNGQCYDVVDTTKDQVYRPETSEPQSQYLDAVAATWPITLRKSGRFFLTGYRDGASVDCGANADGWRLYQHSAYRCATEGLTALGILRTYFEPGLAIVTPGAGDVTGDGLGDVTVLLPQADSVFGSLVDDSDSPLRHDAHRMRALGATVAGGALVARIYNAGVYDAGGVAPPAATASPATDAPLLPPWESPSPSPSPSPASDVPQPPTAIAIDPASIVDAALADVTGDHLDDLIVLQRGDGDGLIITVAPAVKGAGFGMPAPWWWSTGTDFDLPRDVPVRLVADDFDGDGISDVGILAGVPATASTPGSVAQARLYVLLSTGSTLEAPQTWWGPGPLDMTHALPFAADVTGDGKADLVLQTDAYAPSDPTGQVIQPGLRYLVAESRAGGGLDDPRVWLDLWGVQAPGAQTVVVDFNGDGRADIIVGHAFGTSGTQFIGLRSTGTTFAQSVLWSASSGYRWSAVKMVTTDVNGDGRGDIVVLYDLGQGGTRLHQLLSTGSALRSATRSADPTLSWGPAQPL